VSPDLIIPFTIVATIGFIWVVIVARRQPTKNQALADEVIAELQTAGLTPAQIEAIDLWSWSSRVGWHSIHLDPERFPIFAERMRS
jgi:hypothetical protein